jgi:hypothetical protein
MQRDCPLTIGEGHCHLPPSQLSLSACCTVLQVWWNAANQRLFDVSVNGAVVLPNVDPYALAGAKFTAVIREVTRTATGTTMVVSLQAKMDNAALAALEVSRHYKHCHRGPVACTG